MLTICKIILACCLAWPLQNWAAEYYVVVPIKKATAASKISVTLAESALASAQVGQPYAADLTPMLMVKGDAAYNGAGVTWRVNKGVLPAGLALTAAGQIKGTPTEAGSNTVEISATYKTKSGLQAYTLLVQNILVSLRAASPPQANVGQAYAYDLKQQLNVTGDSAYAPSAVTWAVVSNSLPAGLYLTSDGWIGGTPTEAGSGSIVARASYKNVSGDQSYTVIAQGIIVSLANTALPNAKLQASYSSGNLNNLVTVTGDAAYSPSLVTWALHSGSLPAGLALSGASITGTPTASATSNFELTATYNGKSATKLYAITVSPMASCKELLAQQPGLPSGWYTLDADGDGPASPKSYYCDMTSDGGGWTRVARQTEAAPVSNWNGGVNGQSYTLAEMEIPAHTQIGIGKDELATYVDYVTGTYQATDMPGLVTVISPKTGNQYQMYHHTGNFYKFNNPEESFYSYPTNNNPFGDGDWRNALTFDKLGGRAYSWSFSPQHATPAARGFGMNGSNVASTSESYAWTVWVR